MTTDPILRVGFRPRANDGRFMADRISLPTRASVDASQSTAISSPSLRRLVRLIVFCGGISSIGIEITASRLVAPFFGDSTIIWANIIGLTLAFLSLGYWLGGHVADRWPLPHLLLTIVGIAAAFAGIIPTLSHPILNASLRAFQDLSIGAFYGSLLGTLVLICVPITLLGFISPFAMRLLVDDVARAGNTSGNLYALSTVGSIAGSFLPVLLLIPSLGTARTFVALALILIVPVLVALIVLRRPREGGVVASAALVMLVIAVVNGSGPVRAAEFGTTVFETESSYNYIQVVQQGDTTSLILNDGHAVHSVYNPNDVLTGGPWDYFAVAPLINPGAGIGSVHNALLIGLAGGTVAHQLTAAYGPIPIDGVEIDPEIVDVGERYFHMSEVAPGLHVHVADGRYYLRTTSQRYDLIGVDAYHQPYIPFQMTTREFFGEIASHLTPTGVAAMNVGRTATDYRLVNAIASTMHTVFPYVYAIGTARYDNTIVIGSMTPGGADAFRANAQRLAFGTPLASTATEALASGNVRAIDPHSLVFTDDRAPVERVIDLIILNEASRREEQP